MRVGLTGQLLDATSSGEVQSQGQTEPFSRANTPAAGASNQGTAVARSTWHGNQYVTLHGVDDTPLTASSNGTGAGSLLTAYTSLAGDGDIIADSSFVIPRWYLQRDTTKYDGVDHPISGMVYLMGYDAYDTEDWKRRLHTNGMNERRDTTADTIRVGATTARARGGALPPTAVCIRSLVINRALADVETGDLETYFAGAI